MVQVIQGRCGVVRSIQHGHTMWTTRSQRNPGPWRDVGASGVQLEAASRRKAPPAPFARLRRAPGLHLAAAASRRVLAPVRRAPARRPQESIRLAELSNTLSLCELVRFAVRRNFQRRALCPGRDNAEGIPHLPTSRLIGNMTAMTLLNRWDATRPARHLELGTFSSL
jgi:hypothetical protein